MLSDGVICFEYRFCATKKDGIGGGGWFQHGVPCTWQLPWLAVEKLWSALAGPFLSFLTQTDSSAFFSGSICGTVAFTGRRALTIVSSLMSGRDRGHDPERLDGRTLS